MGHGGGLSGGRRVRDCATLVVASEFTSETIWGGEVRGCVTSMGFLRFGFMTMQMPFQNVKKLIFVFSDYYFSEFSMHLYRIYTIR